MTIPQQIFMVFFAIFWGIQGNAQPRWKAFDLGNSWDATTRQRACISFLLLNIVPIIYFLFVFWLFGHRLWQIRTWASWDVLLILPPIIAALGIFGFYKLWMGIVQLRNNHFYGSHFDRQRFNIRLEEEDIDSSYGLGNIIAGVAWTSTMFIMAFSSFFIFCVALSYP